MNAIAAHKDELKKFARESIGRHCPPGITFVASLDAYITRLDYELLRHRRPRQSKTRPRRKQTEN